MKLIFIPGSGGTALVWQYQTDHFTDSVAVTLPGHPHGEACRTIPEAVSWLKDRVEREGWHDLVIVGHSLGGGMALQYALDHPDDLKAIIPIGSGARLRVHPDTLEFMEKMVSMPESYAESLNESYQDVAPEFAEALRATSIRNGPAPALYDLRACDQFDIMDRISGIETPTHAIVGTADVMTPPKYSEYLCKHMPNAGMTVIEGGSHFVFGEYPDQVNQAIEEFLLQLA